MGWLFVRCDAMRHCRARVRRPTLTILAVQQGRADLNPAALASFVFAILGFVALPFLGPLLAIVLGEVAMRQIARSGQVGFAIAKAGTILGAAWFVLALAGIVLFWTLTARPR